MKTTVISREIWVLVAAALAVALGFGILAPILPRYARTFDVSYTGATALVSVFAGMRLVFATPGGKLVDIFGERRMYMAGLLIVALSSAACGFASTYVQLLVLRGIGGIGSVMFTISAMSLIIKLSPPGRRGRASSLYGGAFLIGNIIGPSAGAIMEPLGMQAPFFIYAAFLGLATIVVWIALPSSVGAAKKPEPGSHDVQAMTVREAVKSPVYRATLVTMFSHAWTNMGVRLSLIPLVADVALGNPGWLSGAALTAGAIGTAVSVLGGGGLSDKYGRFAVVVPGLIIAGVFTSVMGIIGQPYILVGFCVLAGLGAGLINPGNQGALADVLGGRKGGNVVSTFQMSGDVGQIVGPLAIGAVADLWGFGPAFAISGAILIVAVLAWTPARGEAYSGYRSA